MMGDYPEEIVKRCGSCKSIKGVIKVALALILINSLYLGVSHLQVQRLPSQMVADTVSFLFEGMLSRLLEQT